MADLGTLRPEVREAINRTDMTVEMFDTLVTVNRDDYDIIRAELLRLAHDCKEHADWRQLNHQAYFDADQRAEKAEAELAALTKKCTCSRRSVSSPIGCRVCNPQLEIADLESKLATSEAKLAALKARPFHGIVLAVDDLVRGHAGLPSEWRGKRVRLVVEE